MNIYLKKIRLELKNDRVSSKFINEDLDVIESISPLSKGNLEFQILFSQLKYKIIQQLRNQLRISENINFSGHQTNSTKSTLTVPSRIDNNRELKHTKKTNPTEFLKYRDIEELENSNFEELDESELQKQVKRKLQKRKYEKKKTELLSWIKMNGSNNCYKYIFTNLFSKKIHVYRHKSEEKKFHGKVKFKYYTEIGLGKKITLTFECKMFMKDLKISNVRVNFMFYSLRSKKWFILWKSEEGDFSKAILDREAWLVLRNEVDPKKRFSSSELFQFLNSLSVVLKAKSAYGNDLKMYQIVRGVSFSKFKELTRFLKNS